MQTITVGELEKIFAEIIRKLSFLNNKEIIIEDDLYNKITADQWSIFEKPEDKIVIGSLQDDAEWLKKMINEDDGICTYVDFDRTASILQYISQKLNPVDG